ncbi:MAG: NADH dehydrogenase [ubiquinone] 1 alpha subcomplex assembly factor 1 [Shewanella sp.]|jgi:NADH dehydrogenase [ubiquinone] 1 alpha subcomplex assembly factor 1
MPRINEHFYWNVTPTKYWYKPANIVLLIGSLIMSATSLAKPIIIDTADRWNLINDSVMGGISTSSLTNDGDISTFSGDLSLERNGGFASTRASLTSSLASDTAHIKITVKGDGREYQLRLRTDDKWDAIAYSYPFKTEKGQWLTFSVSAKEFVAVFRGRAVNAPSLSLGNIKQIGFLLADKQPGAFSLSFQPIEVE